VDKLKSAWAAFDGALPRLWKSWIFTALLVVLLSWFVVSWMDRLGVILGKVPLITIGGLLGYYGDRGLFPYARPGDIKEKLDSAIAAGLASSDQAVWASVFNTACIRRALVVVGCAIGMALAA
jgi:hypothetical protein